MGLPRAWVTGYEARNLCGVPIQPCTPLPNIYELITALKAPGALDSKAIPHTCYVLFYKDVMGPGAMTSCLGTSGKPLGCPCHFCLINRALMRKMRPSAPHGLRRKMNFGSVSLVLGQSFLCVCSQSNSDPSRLHTLFCDSPSPTTQTPQCWLFRSVPFREPAWDTSRYYLTSWTFASLGPPSVQLTHSA